MTFPPPLMLAMFGATTDVYAPGSATGGTSAAMVQVGTAAVGLLVPSTNQQAAGFVDVAPIGLAGGRTTHLWIDRGTATVGLGCELRTAAGTFFVEGTADWRIGRVALLSKVTTPYVAAVAAPGTANPWFEYNQPTDLNYIYHFLY